MERLHDGFALGLSESRDVEIININVTPADTTKLSGLAIVADAREAIDVLATRSKGGACRRISK